MQASKLRFSAAHLFYLVSLTAAAVGLLGWLGLPAAAFIVLVWLQILAGAEREAQAINAACEDELQADLPLQGLLPQAQPAYAPRPIGARISREGISRMGISKVELLVVMIIATLLVGLMMPAASDADPLLHAETSMKMVAKAARAYEQQYGRLPQVLYAEDGTPLHSWRALILPFLGEEKLAASYRLEEAWNSPHNLQLSQYRPWHYQVYYPGEKAHATATSLHILRDADDRLHVIEHEAAIDNWLKPVESASSEVGWRDFAAVPPVHQGFWNRGFFVSSYRGRLAVCGENSFQVHPQYLQDGTDVAEPLAPQLAPAQSNKVTTAEPRSVLGETYRQWHFDNALRLSFFLLMVLYPYRWLKKLQA